MEKATTPAKWPGHLAALGAYLIFGFNIIVCKDLTSSTYISPMGIFMLRSVGAGLIFWTISLFMKPEKVSPRDLVGIFFASLLGFFLTQITFLVALPMVTPMETALLGSMTPVYTMLIAAVATHEPITTKKVSGVLLSLAGVVYLILTGIQGGFSDGGSNLWGLLIMVGNALFFSMYLGIFRPLIRRYSVVTFMKWIFLFAALMGVIPTTAELVGVDYAALPSRWLWEMAFLIVMSTFVAYFLIPFGQKRIRPTLVGMYSYAQPIVAIGISIAAGMERLTVAKVVATIMVFTGVYIVSRSKAAPH